MSSSSPQIPKVLNVLIVLGSIGWVLAFSFGFYIAMKLAPLTDATNDSNNTQMVGELGEEGSMCGGPQRLPCNPGLVCDATNGEAKTGRCVKDMRAMSPLGEVGQSCGGDVGCSPGLMCVSTEGGSFCMPVATGTAPMAQ